jgi:carboxypeptidase family protein
LNSKLGWSQRLIVAFVTQHERATAAVALLVLLSLTTLGQNASTQAVRIGSITGRVVNESGQPLPNAIVTIHVLNGSKPDQMTTTDKDGKFEMNGLDSLVYQVFARLSAYTTLPRDDNSPNNYRIGDKVTIVMIKGGVITGTVTSQTADPVVGVRVWAKMVRSNGQPATSELMIQRATDDRGLYRIYGLPTGTYVVWAGGGGEVMSSGWDPYDADVPTYSPSSTRDTAAEINVQAGAETTNIDIRYRGEPGRTVSGTVINQEDGPGGAVTLTSADDGGSRVVVTSFQPADGSGFSFYGVDDGDYDLTARALLGGGEWALSLPKRIRVRGADVTGVELLVRRLGSVKGQIVLEELKTKECTDKQRPVLTEALVSAWHKEDEVAKKQPRFVWSLGAPVNADAQGNVWLRNLAPGDYYFVTRFAGKSWYLQSITVAAAKKVDATRAWTNVKSGERISGLTITLAEGAASLAGRFVLAQGETLSEKLFVYLVPAEKEKAEDVLRFYAAAASADGNVTANNVAPGRYWVLAKAASHGVQTKLRLPDANEIRAQLRREAEGGKTEIELKACASVSDYQFKMP